MAHDGQGSRHCAAPDVAPGPPPKVQRNADGIGKGGIRTPPVDVPVAVLSGLPGPSSSPIYLLSGSTKPFTAAQLAALYPSRAKYLQRYKADADKTIKAGFALPEDRAALLAFAEPSLIKGYTGAVSDEGVLDPRVVEWFEANPIAATPLEDLTPEILELARSPVGAPPTRDIARVRDDVVEGIPVRVYENDHPPDGLIVYFHGGGFCIGSIGLMDNVARELAHCANAAVISVEYRLAPENPYPAGLDDCEIVTRWALANASNFGADANRVVVAGESAGGNLSAAVSLRLRASADPALAGQVLMYPGVDGGSRSYPSRDEFAGIVLTHKSMDSYWSNYTAGRDLERDQFAAPLHAESLAELPPAVVVLGGSDPLRDEGRAYAARLRDAGVAVEEVCFTGQPHGFINFGVPAAADAFEHIGSWLRSTFRSA